MEHHDAFLEAIPVEMVALIAVQLEMQSLRLLRISQNFRQYLLKNRIIEPPRNHFPSLDFSKNCSHLLRFATQLPTTAKSDDYERQWKPLWFNSTEFTALERFELFMSSSLERQSQLYRLTAFAGKKELGFPAIVQFDLHFFCSFHLFADQSVAVFNRSSIFTLHLNGTISRIIGNETDSRAHGNSPDGTLAKTASIGIIRDARIDEKGRIVFLEVDPHETKSGRIRRIEEDGALCTLAGGGTCSDDQCPAFDADLSKAQNFIIRNDGRLVICDAGNYQIRELGSDGILRVIAGSRAEGQWEKSNKAAMQQKRSRYNRQRNQVAEPPKRGYSEDKTRADEAIFSFLDHLFELPDGTLAVNDGGRIPNAKSFGRKGKVRLISRDGVLGTMRVVDAKNTEVEFELVDSRVKGLIIVSGTDGFYMRRENGGCVYRFSGGGFGLWHGGPVSDGTFSPKSHFVGEIGWIYVSQGGSRVWRMEGWFECKE